MQCQTIKSPPQTQTVALFSLPHIQSEASVRALLNLMPPSWSHINLLHDIITSFYALYDPRLAGIRQ